MGLLVSEAPSAALGLHASMLIEFVQEISIGHIILMPDTPRGDIAVGDVTGPYEFHPDLPPERYRHRRTVAWFGRVPAPTCHPAPASSTDSAPPLRVRRSLPRGVH